MTASGPPSRASLDRLGVDSVDIVYLHDVEHHLREVHETGFPALAELRAERPYAPSVSA